LAPRHGGAIILGEKHRVLIAILTDIHGNREALEACLASVREKNADRHVFLGDFVGYGADPGFVIDTVMPLMEQGAIGLLGNHDSAAVGNPESMNDDAARAIAWTRAQLNDRQLDFLAGLPFTAQDGDVLYVHASADAPIHWDYMLDADAALRSFKATSARVTICGHVHVPILFQLSKARGLAAFEPPSGEALPMNEGRWIAVIGAVGQPRDGNPHACYALYDDEADTLTYVRVPYDVDAAAKKIKAAGLPRRLAARLAFGQ
jgi:diadenosine tetraphosphatase ApaH/serine/threonine PP2A family protein phosphatase